MGGRGFNFEIVGEASYQPALDDICGGKCEEGHELPKVAQLCFQEDNPYDPNAVVVLIDTKVVGYIPRNLAKGIRDEILRLNPEERPVTCAAKVVGGWVRQGGDEGHYGVKLSLSHPLKPTALGPKLNRCISTIAVTRCETNGWKWPLFTISYLFVLAYWAAGATPDDLRVRLGSKADIREGQDCYQPRRRQPMNDRTIIRQIAARISGTLGCLVEGKPDMTGYSP